MPDMGGPSLRDCRIVSLPPSPWQVLGTGLNCSESGQARFSQRLQCVTFTVFQRFTICGSRQCSSVLGHTSIHAARRLLRAALISMLVPQLSLLHSKMRARSNVQSSPSFCGGSNRAQKSGVEPRCYQGTDNGAGEQPEDPYCYRPHHWSYAARSTRRTATSDAAAR
jgi:hypothetical protein